ncbi:DUF3604 domain-containing protein [Parahaliea maris]|uniref:DUF3604 domain-containing protein n=1 Tax=Parahaliea maris TaxID=2716870 RepID=A0A5C9AA30_9GAMM|nr:DUF3604 domain-containing protein [Parahaliea maris]TXS96141.1 DUF3604 domain-containing protein [Parahaliea maris]
MQRHIIPAVVLTIGIAGCSDFDDPTIGTHVGKVLQPDLPSRAVVPPNATRNLLWGDLHVHTALSYDAFTMGTRTLPDDAYNYMKGGTIMHGLGYPIRARRPLDFGAVTDHAEYLGVPRHLAGSQADQLDEGLINALKSGSALRFTAYYFYRIFSSMSSREKREETFGRDDLQYVSDAAWQDIQQAAENHNEPGRFTTFVAYEYSSMPDERNLHRNVIYKSARVPDYPYTSRDSSNPEDLWRVLDAQREQGMDVLAIPHNGNVSGGRMYESRTFNGSAIDAEYAELRSRNEPLSEIFQVKGTSETHPSLSPADEFADFALMDTLMTAAREPSTPKGSYSRDALRTGLEFAHREGYNPYQFGVIGSSDSHNSSSSTEEDNFHGKLPLMDGSPSQRLTLAYLSDKATPITAYGAAGLVAVWAQQNTRESIFEAMQRKETYATSGPRIALRFFAGWGYDDLTLDGDWLVPAYAGGVPMGSSLKGSIGAESPTFLLSAQKDPLGANLDRLQVIKAWVDEKGRSHEVIYDIAGSGEDTEGAASYSRTWRDPEFNSAQHAFYYARAIEKPTPRYTTHDAERLGVEPPEPVTIQERAVSSAIWYSP